MIYIIAAILIFGVLIAVHELGHFLAAKACGVRSTNFPSVWAPPFCARPRGHHLLSAAAAHRRLLCHGGRGGGLQRPHGP